jgi:hypothetical protein
MMVLKNYSEALYAENKVLGDWLFDLRISDNEYYTDSNELRNTLLAFQSLLV